MRRYVAASLILMMVFSLLGPYYAEATGSAVGNNQIDYLEDGSVKSPDLQSNQSKTINSSENVIGDADSIEFNENEEVSTGDDSVNQSNNSNIEETISSNKEESSDSTENNVDEAIGENRKQGVTSDSKPKDELEKTADNKTKAEGASISLKQAIKQSSINMLGHIKNSTVKIYTDLNNLSSYFLAGSSYTNAVYYIKKQAVTEEGTYYLISTNASSVDGVVGWVKSSDLTTRTHVEVDKNSKTFYIKGTDKAYNKPWGGSKNLVYADLSVYKGQVFQVNLTEQVGNNTWYRGMLGGKTVWIHSSYVSADSVLTTYTDYNLTLNKMVEIQMAVSPQTDKSYKLYLREDAFGSISNGKGTVNGNNWNLRRGPGTMYLADGQVNNGTVLTLYSSTKGTDGYTWYHVRNTYGWVVANPEDVLYYLNPFNFTGNLKNSMQFVKLSESANINVSEVNRKILANKGILAGQAQAFIDGGKANRVNEIYLIAHALLETGNGTSPLATGVEVGRDSKGKLVVVTDSNRKNLTAIKKTYNMYGINAIDSNPLVGGATYAYEKEWFTPEAAIKGGAAFIGSGYVNAGQDTLYKMRWNPLFAANYGYASHQYATDIGWAFKQTSKMYDLYQLLDQYSIVFDIPRYR